MHESDGDAGALQLLGSLQTSQALGAGPKVWQMQPIYRKGEERSTQAESSDSVREFWPFGATHRLQLGNPSRAVEEPGTL